MDASCIGSPHLEQHPSGHDLQTRREVGSQLLGPAAGRQRCRSCRCPRLRNSVHSRCSLPRWAGSCCLIYGIALHQSVSCRLGGPPPRLWFAGTWPWRRNAAISATACCVSSSSKRAGASAQRPLTMGQVVLALASSRSRYRSCAVVARSIISHLASRRMSSNTSAMRFRSMSMGRRFHRRRDARLVQLSHDVPFRTQHELRAPQVFRRPVQKFNYQCFTGQS